MAERPPEPTLPDRLVLPVSRTWDGQPARADERAAVEVRGLAAGGDVHVRVTAPWHGDPPPAWPAGPTPKLWEHEVVELFLLGDGERYLEVELGPRGHHLVLELDGRRNAVRQGHPMAYEVARDGDAWRGEAVVPRAWLPAGLCRVNAYAIHGAGAGRRYLCWSPTGGDAPDFHRLEAFGGLTDAAADVNGTDLT